MNAKRAALRILVLFLALGGGPSGFAQTTEYSCTDLTGISLQFEIPLDGTIHEVLLTVDTGRVQTPGDVAYTLALPGGPPQGISAGTINTGSDTDDGYLITLSADHAAGSYSLSVRDRPDAFPWGVFDTSTPAGAWEFTLSGLDPASDPHALLASFDDSPVPAPVAAGGAGFTAHPCPSAVNQSPTASFTAVPASGNAPLAVGFDGSGSDDPDGTVTAYHWDFGDGSAPPPLSESAPPHTYRDHGVYTAELYVTDDDGADSAAVSQEITAYPVETLCFPPHLNVAGSATFLEPPLIDGGVGEDTGWNQALRVTHAGGAEPEVAFQGLRDREPSRALLYLSFEVRNDNGLDEDDLILLAFSPDNDPATTGNDRILAIYPFGPGAVPGSDLPPAKIRIWAEGAGWSDLSPAAAAAMNLEVKICSDIPGQGNAWDAELQVPSALSSGAWADFDDTFLFYYNVMRVIHPPLGAGTLESSWPRNVPAVAGDVETHAYSPLWWSRGDKSPGAVCRGVRLDWADLGIQENPGDPLGHTIALPVTGETVTNRFVARLHNDSERAIPSPPYVERLDATDVRVRFRIANWGIPSREDWTDIPAPAPAPDCPTTFRNPTCYETVPGGTAGVAPGEKDFVFEWTLNRTTDSALIAEYQSSRHQCVLAEIDSSADTVISSRSVYSNMEFVDASEFSRQAEISARGYGPPAGGRSSHRVVLFVTRRQWEKKLDPAGSAGTETPEAPAEGGETVASSQEWIAYGYLDTGKTVTINGRTYPIYASLGAFGYVLEHQGAVRRWEEEIEGAEEGNPSYIVEVPAEGSAVITTTFRPVPDVRRWQASLHAGVTEPLGGLAGTYDRGPCFIADLGFRPRPGFWLLGLFGYHGLGPRGSGSSTCWLNLALNARYVRALGGALSAYAGGGGGLYLPKSGTALLGVNAGGGFAYALSRSLSFELGADLHTLFDGDSYLTAQAGIVLRP